MTLLEKLLTVSVFASILLTLGLLLVLGFHRVSSVNNGTVATKDIAVDRNAYPLAARLLSNNIDNQFQLPVLFYVAALLSLVAGGTGWVEVGLAWLFVALRYLHTAIHITTNRVHRRFLVYTAGLAVLTLLWVWLVARLLITGSSI